jgi:hypothetical protein
MSHTTLTRETIRAIDAYWAASFGCPVEALRPSRTLVLPHDAHERFNGAYAMAFGAEPIVSVPPGELSELRATLSHGQRRRSWLHRPRANRSATA